MLPVEFDVGEEERSRWSTAEAWQKEIETRHGTNRHLLALLEEPWFETMLQSPGCGKLWQGSRRRLLKELSESYSLLIRLRRMRPQASEGSSGGGMVLFDVCSGKGFTALLLSHAFPAARVIMIDSDIVMNTSHTNRLENVEFKRLDLFSTQCIDVIQEAAQNADWACAFGMHLCGALSPRLIAIFGCIPEICGLVLSPCCLKGYLGKQCQQRAREQGKDPYAVLCLELLAMARATGVAESCALLFDSQVLSAKNGFLISLKDLQGNTLEEADDETAELLCGTCVEHQGVASLEVGCLSPWMHV